MPPTSWWSCDVSDLASNCREKPPRKAQMELDLIIVKDDNSKYMGLYAHGIITASALAENFPCGGGSKVSG